MSKPVCEVVSVVTILCPCVKHCLQECHLAASSCRTVRHPPLYYCDVLHEASNNLYPICLYLLPFEFMSQFGLSRPVWPLSVSHQSDGLLQRTVNQEFYFVLPPKSGLTAARVSDIRPYYYYWWHNVWGVGLDLPDIRFAVASPRHPTHYSRSRHGCCNDFGRVVLHPCAPHRAV